MHELHVAVVVDGDPRERRVCLALRAGHEAQHVRGRMISHVAVANERARRDAQVSEALPDLERLVHPAPHERHLAPELYCDVAQNLEAVDARGKGGNHQLAFGAGKQLLERLLDLELRAGVAPAVDVRAVAEQRQHTLGPEPRKSLKVERLPVERGLVDLEVACVDERALRGSHHYSHAVGHAVGYPEETRS
jgi:hypothetical protein